VKSTIRPLLELCAHDLDIITVQYCRKLLFWLLKDMSEASYKALSFDPFRPSKEFKAKEADEAGPASAPTEEGKEPEKPVRRPKKTSKIMESYMERKKNATEQYNALLSFKESLCSEQAIKAIVVLFGKMWQAEIAIKEEFAISKNMNIPNNKLVDISRQSYISVNVCLICVCRLLEIDTQPAHSDAQQVKNMNDIHNKLIVYLRTILMALPGIFTELYNDIKSHTRYFDSWLSYLFRILRNTMRRFRAQDLFLIWQEGGLLDTKDHANSFDSNPISVPIGIQKRHGGNSMPTRNNNGKKMPGILKSHLADERTSRAISLGFRPGGGAIDSRHSRFGGVFVRPISSSSTGSSSNDLEGDEIDPMSGVTVDQQRANDKLSSRATAFVKRGVQIAMMTQELPTAKAKSTRRSIAFAQDSVHNSAKSGEAMSRSAQEASVVVASVADLLCESKGLNEMIKRVNEDLRRDEGIFYDDMEIVYFEILSKMLAYNRYKLMAEKASFEKRVNDGDAMDEVKDSDLQTHGWVPDLRNMIEATSNMSENRIVRSIDDLCKKKNLQALYKPIECFKELICYIRIELQSSNLGHRDLAVAALFRIFYTLTTDRRDPLPKLLNDWKASTYTKQHSQCLVELLHETMKTLDLAQSIYSDEAEIAKARKIRLKKGSMMDIEQYTAAAYRFDTNEYFRKLVSNGSVRLYTRLLEKYATNDATVNHYVYCFFQRLNNFQLEQSFPTPHPIEVDAKEGQSQALPAPMTLGYILFNISTMNSFTLLLNDSTAQTNKTLAPLMSLAKTIIRRFGDAAQKNPLLFVECLFQHTNPAKHACERIDNIYEAQAYRQGTDSYQSRELKDHKKLERAGDDIMDGEDSASDDDNNQYRAADSGFVIADDEDEFDENDANVAAVPKNFKRMQAKKKKELEKLARKESRKAKKMAEMGNDATMLSTRNSEKVKKDKSRSWSKEEDLILNTLFPQYAGSHSIFSIIAEDEGLRAIGKNRSATAVERRCRELELHMTTGQMADSSDDEVAPKVRTENGLDEINTQSQNARSQDINSLDLDDYAVVANGSGSKKRKIKRNADAIVDSDEENIDDDIIDTVPFSTEKAAVRRNMVIDSDDD
jgi:hypothetical protein